MSCKSTHTSLEVEYLSGLAVQCTKDKIFSCYWLIRTASLNKYHIISLAYQYALVMVIRLSHLSIQQIYQYFQKVFADARIQKFYHNRRQSSFATYTRHCQTYKIPCHHQHPPLPSLPPCPLPPRPPGATGRPWRERDEEPARASSLIHQPAISLKFPAICCQQTSHLSRNKSYSYILLLLQYSVLYVSRLGC